MDMGRRGWETCDGGRTRFATASTEEAAASGAGMVVAGADGNPAVLDAAVSAVGPVSWGDAKT